MAKILSLQVGLPRRSCWRGREVDSAIVKEPVAGRVAARRYGLAGDDQADKKHHGGANQAVYAFAAEHYAPWAELGYRDLPWGAFGENLTTLGVVEAEIRAGDLFRAGTALLEARGPRIPCAKLAMRMGTPKAVKDFVALGRPGVYYRVIEEGALAAGDAFTLERRAAHAPTIHEIAAVRHAPEPARVAALLALPGLPEEWRAHFTKS